MPVTTTLEQIRSWSPCESGWRKLLSHLGKTKADSEHISLLTVLESNGLDDALWCLRAVEGYDKEKRLFAVWCARQVVHLTIDPRVSAALDVAEKFANGEATQEELHAAACAAYAAADAADAAACAAACAAYAAADAADAAACAAAYAAAYAADAAYAAYAADAAAYAAARAAQTEKVKEIFG